MPDGGHRGRFGSLVAVRGVVVRLKKLKQKKKKHHPHIIYFSSPSFATTSERESGLAVVGTSPPDFRVLPH